MAYDDDERYRQYQEWINSLPRPQVLAAEGVETPVAIEDVEANVPVSQGFMHVGTMPRSEVAPPFDLGMTSLGRSESDDAFLTQQNRILNDQENGITPRMRQDAERASGMLEYESLIQGGATPQEAYLRVAPKINPRGFARDIQRATPFQPSVTEVGGVKFARTGPNSAKVMTEPKPLPDKLTPGAQEQLKTMRGDLVALQRKSADKDNWRGLTKEEQARMEELKQAIPGFAGSPTNMTSYAPLALSAPTAKVSEVTRKVGNRRAIFDANTKQFLRYAD